MCRHTTLSSRCDTLFGKHSISNPSRQISESPDKDRPVRKVPGEKAKRAGARTVADAADAADAAAAQEVAQGWQDWMKKMNRPTIAEIIGVHLPGGSIRIAGRRY